MMANERQLLALGVERHAVRRLDMTALRRIIEALQAEKIHGKDRLVIFFDGYDHMVEEIYEIPEIRKWTAKVLDTFPHIFYFLTNRHGYNSLNNFANCLGNVQALQPLHMRMPAIQMQPEQFLNNHFLISLQMPKALHRKIVDATIAYATCIGESDDAIQRLLKRFPWALDGQ